MLSNQTHSYQFLIVEVASDIYQQTNKRYNSQFLFYHKYQELKRQVEKDLPLIVLANIPPQHYKVRKIDNSESTTYLNTKTNKIEQFPRENSFEVCYMGGCIHSKLQTKIFPDIPLLIEKLRDLYRRYINEQGGVIQRRYLKTDKSHSPIQTPSFVTKQYNMSPYRRLPPVNKTPDVNGLRLDEYLFGISQNQQHIGTNSVQDMTVKAILVKKQYDTKNKSNSPAKLQNGSTIQSISSHSIKAQKALNNPQKIIKSQSSIIRKQNTIKVLRNRTKLKRTYRKVLMFIWCVKLLRMKFDAMRITKQYLNKLLKL